MISSILSRYEAAKERWPIGSGIRTEVHLTINDARLFYAAGQWLRKYDEWRQEAEKSNGSIGVYPAEFGLSACAKFLNDAAAKIDKTEPIISLTEKEMKVLNAASFHLDHYELMLSFKDNKSKGNWKRK